MTETLYEWAGGIEAFARLIDAFYDRVEADDLLAGFFPGGVSAKHRGLGITPEHRFRFASLMSLAADDAQLPARRRGRRARTGAPLGLGRSTALPALTHPSPAAADLVGPAQIATAPAGNRRRRVRDLLRLVRSGSEQHGRQANLVCVSR